MSEHDRVRKNLPGLAARTLAPREAASADAHLAECAACARELARWRRLLAGVERLPEPELAQATIARLAVRARAHRQEVLERRWNRLVLTGLILYGWSLFTVILPLLPIGVGWLAERLAMPWFALVVLGLGLWWSFCWVIGLALLPLFRTPKVKMEENVL